MTMSTDLVQLLLAQVTESSFNALMTITFPKASGSETWHVCNNKTPIVLDGIRYDPIYFAFDPPNDASNGSAQNGQITLSCVDQSVPAEILAVTGQIELSIITLVSRATGAQEELEGWDFVLANAQWNATTMTADLIYTTYMDVNVPGLAYDTENFPGCW